MSSAATIEQSAPQHLTALARANRVRLARAGLKRRIARGEVAVEALLSEPPWEAAGMTVSDLLISQHRWGSTRCRKLLMALRISETRTVGSLTTRQRAELAACLRGEPVGEPLTGLPLSYV